VTIDGGKIIQAVMERSKIRDAKGILPLFGVYLSLCPVDYYIKVSFDFEKKMKGKGLEKEAPDLLVEAAQECGYATFQGIRNSWEWDQVVHPMIRREEDQIVGFTSMAVAFGWGDMLVKELIPGERLLIQVRDSYEATGYLEKGGRAHSGKCYMLRGVTAAFMDLLYGEDYPEGCFAFSAQETLCRAKGDPYCEFLAEKKR
jgi:predicted hydrocarbon binding protein